MLNELLNGASQVKPNSSNQDGYIKIPLIPYLCDLKKNW